MTSKGSFAAESFQNDEGAKKSQKVDYYLFSLSLSRLRVFSSWSLGGRLSEKENGGGLGRVGGIGWSVGSRQGSGAGVPAVR